MLASAPGPCSSPKWVALLAAVAIDVSGGAAYPTNTSTHCYTLHMNDTYGDGWDLGFAMLTDWETNATLLGPTGVASGSYSVAEFCVENGCKRLTVGGSQWEEELVWTVGSVQGGAPWDHGLLFQDGLVASSCSGVRGEAGGMLVDCPSAATLTLHTAADLAAALAAQTAGSCIHVALGASLAMSLDAELVVPPRSRVLIDGAASILHGLGAGRIFRVDGGGYLELRNLTLAGGSAYIGGCVLVAEDSKFLAVDTVLSNCTAAAAGGAVHGLTGGELAFEGKSFVVNSSAPRGGALCSSAGSIEVGGQTTISQCEATGFGGAVYVIHAATAHLKDQATISQCEAVKHGGAIFATYSSTVEMKDRATISRCKTSSRGGAILANKGSTVDLKNQASISRCQAAILGGGLCIYNSASLKLQDHATVAECEATRGGGVFMFMGSNSLHFRDHAAVTSCRASMGGGVFVQGASPVRFDGASAVQNCTAAAQGGGLMMIGATVELRGSARIADCNSGDNGGGGVYSQDSSLVFGGQAAVMRCSAKGKGGGIYSSRGQVLLEGSAAVAGCSAGADGGGIAYSSTDGTGTLSSTLALSENATVLGCQANTSGGGISVVGSHATVRIQSSHAIGIAGQTAAIANCSAVMQGGGLFVRKSRVEMGLYGAVADCVAKAGGGLYLDQGARAILADRAQITRSSATGGDGGAVLASNAGVVFRDAASITLNRARRGGGAFITGERGSVFASSSACALVELEVQSTDVQSPAGAVAMVSDAAAMTRTPLLTLAAVEGSKTTAPVCLPPGEYFMYVLADAVMSRGKGAEEAARVMDPAGMPLTSWTNVSAGRFSSRTQFVVPANTWAAAAGGSVRMAGNEATVSDGAGLHVSGGARGVIDGVFVAENRAPFGRGGGVYVSDGGKLQVSSSWVDFNSARGGGGIFASALAVLTVADTSVFGNSANEIGGGLGVGFVVEANISNTSIRANTASVGGGLCIDGAASGTVRLSSSNITENRARTRGAAIAADGFSLVEAERLWLVDNEVVEGSGTLAVSSGSTVSFGGSVTACSFVSIMTDWTETRETCSPIPQGWNAGRFCAEFSSSCQSLAQDISQVLSDCDGCVCSDDFETHYAITKLPDVGTVLYRGQPITSGIKRDTYCLSAGRYEVRAFDQRGKEWFGGRLWIDIEHADGTRHTVSASPNGTLPWLNDTESVAVSFEVRERSTESAVRGNRAPKGGGAFVFLDGADEPIGLWSGAVVDGGGNVASYGAWTATPVRSLLMRAELNDANGSRHVDHGAGAGSTTLMALRSGESTPVTWVFEMLDFYAQHVVADSQSVLRAALVDGNQTAARAQASEGASSAFELVRGTAVASEGTVSLPDLAIYGRPGARVTLRFSLLGHDQVPPVLVPAQLDPCSFHEIEEALLGNTVWRACRACPPGERKFNESCEPCSAGKHSTGGSTLCLECEEGTFSEEGSAVCHRCGVGRYGPNKSAAECEDCPLGYFSSSSGQRICDACSEQFATSTGVTTMRRSFNGNGTAQSFQIEGAKSSQDCTCNAGFYKDAQPGMLCTWTTRGCTARAMQEVNGSAADANITARCMPCFEGMQCNGMGELIIEPGYSWDPSAHSTFKCHADAQRCPGGPPGECATGRHGIACSLCLPGKAPRSGGICGDECEKSAALPIACVVGIVVGLFALYMVSEGSKRAASNLYLVACMTISTIIVTTVQEMRLMGTFDVVWEGLMKDMVTSMAFASLDLDMFRASCDSEVASSPLGYLLQLGQVVVILALACSTHVAVVCVKWRGAFRARMPQLVKFVGSIGFSFIVALMSSAVVPFRCQQHPNGKPTIQGFPSIFCGSGSSYGEMVSISVASLAINLTMIAACAYAACVAPKRLSHGQASFVDACDFLFGKLQPSGFFYSTFYVIRNALLPICPTLPVPILQIAVALLLYLASLVFLATIQPWRSARANHADTASNLFMIMLMLCAAIHVTDRDGTIHVTTIVVALLSLSLLACFLCAVAAYLRSFSPYLRSFSNQHFKWYVCGDFSATGAVARLIKLRVGDGVCIGACVGDAEQAFDIVCHRTEALLLLASAECFRVVRCVGELASHHTVYGVDNRDGEPSRPQPRPNRVVYIQFPGYSHPAAHDIATFIIAVDTGVLAARGISVDMVQDALQWFAGLTPSCTFTSQSTPHSLCGVLGQVVPSPFANASSSAPGSAESSLTTTAPFLVLVDSASYKAVAAAFLLCHLIKSAIDTEPALWKSDTPLPSAARKVIVLLHTRACDESGLGAAISQVMSKEGLQVIFVAIEDGACEAAKALLPTVNAWIASEFMPQRIGSSDRGLDRSAKKLALWLDAGDDAAAPLGAADADAAAD
mmetsp:Transcript_89315/g.273532  ORF Transcript_89315/g.273532 Transcript_89315/m.273532 type:complete len:2355 (-) Transcript_89315:351-7415(-)